MIECWLVATAMDLMSYLSDDEWEVVKEPLDMEGFDEYRIVHRCSEGGGNFKYSAVHTRDEIPVEIRISGASPNRDPLKEIQLIKLRVDTNKFITGMEDCGDCVVRKWCDKIYENSFYIYILRLCEVLTI